MFGIAKPLWQKLRQSSQRREEQVDATDKKHAGLADLIGRQVPDWNAVATAVGDLLIEHSVYEPPVPLDSIVRSQQLTIQFAKFPDRHSKIAGFIRLPEQTIYVNEADAPKRQTFTIAHELGHWMLHRAVLDEHPEMYRVLLRRGENADRAPLEQEANGFAGRLLVPRPLLDRYWKFATVKPAVSTLAKIFAVSEDVIRYRLNFEYRV